MDVFEQAMKTIPGGRVLDVATGGGDAIQELMANLGDYDEFIGIDTNGRAIEAARKTFEGQEHICFVKMDAEHLDFEDASFDTVCLSNSLHHMTDLPQVLGEMMRVLKPEGWAIFVEMYCDGDQTAAQHTHIKMHHWWGEIDQARGNYHEKTFARQKIVELIKESGFKNLAFYDYADLEQDPQAAEVMEILPPRTKMMIERCQELPNAEVLVKRGQELLQRLHEVGFCSASMLLAVGQK